MRVKISMDDAKYRINSMITIFSINAVHAKDVSEKVGTSSYAYVSMTEKTVSLRVTFDRLRFKKLCPIASIFGVSLAMSTTCWRS